MLTLWQHPRTGESARYLTRYKVSSDPQSLLWLIGLPPVLRYPAQERVGGDAKIPTVIYYDNEGKPAAVGAETLADGIETKAEENGWVKAHW